MPSLVYFALCLYLHACIINATPLTVLKRNSVRESECTQHRDKISYSTDAMLKPLEFENQRASVAQQIKGNYKVRKLYSWNFLQEAAERKAKWKSSERLTLEILAPPPPSSNAERTVKSEEEKRINIVMDYEQPHRKPPIHNWEP